jgi:hypothetical protein
MPSTLAKDFTSAIFMVVLLLLDALTAQVRVATNEDRHSQVDAIKMQLKN